MESSLYLPVKRFLEKLGFEVKGEVCGCDLVALDGGSPPAVVIGELKLTFTLDLVLQAVDRTAACDEVWLAVRASRRGRGREGDPRVKKLCRYLGFGLLAVFASGKVEVIVEPVPWRPRRDGKRRSRIVEEHRRRRGDPAAGGSTRQPIMTAYRQQALACAAALAAAPARPRDLKAGIPDAPKILLGNVYGWFVEGRARRVCADRRGPGGAGAVEGASSRRRRIRRSLARASQGQSGASSGPMRVLICGGGVIGASIAYFLSLPQVEAVVIERTGVACAASGKSGGFLALDWCDGTPLEALARRSFALQREPRRRDRRRLGLPPHRDLSVAGHGRAAPRPGARRCRSPRLVARDVRRRTPPRHARRRRPRSHPGAFTRR